MEDRLRVAVGLADLCELMSAAFAFPTIELAEALADGSYAGDCSACFEDAAVDACCEESFSIFSSRNCEELHGTLRKGHSLLYLTPGGSAPVWPYEAAFLFAASGREGEPSLFRSACQIDVERHMREAGVLPKDSRTEPSDSVWNEFSFLSYLYGNVAKALYEGREADAVEWSGRIVRFWGEHASKWLPAFMEKTMEEAPRHSFGSEYAALAEVGAVILGAIDKNVGSSKV